MIKSNIFKIKNIFRKEKTKKIAMPMEDYAKVLRSLMAVEPWCADFVQLSDDFIEIRGWAIARQGDFSKKSFTINGHEFEKISYPIIREDIGRLFWYIPGSKNSGFICRTSLPRDAIFSKGYAVFSYVDKETKQPLRIEHNYYYCDNHSDNAIPLPNTERRIKVHGGDSESAFLLEGFSTYMKLKLALREIVKKDYNDFLRILDWGCGCGRMTRYFRDIKGPLITGIDIDSDNINWCRQNLPFGHFENIPIYPPTALHDSSFDLLIGISIFTHLREKEQFLWLSELQRIASDGAILLMTIHSNGTICRSGMDYDSFDVLNVNGFLDSGHNTNLDSVMQGNDYYRNTFHTHEYIMKNWSKYFEIIDIVPGYIGNHQDLVIMRKRQ